MTYPALFRLPLAAALVFGLAATAEAQPLERARAAQARGDLRAAQIELRNAVRDDPRSASARAALATASLDLGDGVTAEKEARTALELGLDQATGTSLLLRAILVQGKFSDLLRDFPVPPGPPAVAGQVAAARALAQLSLDQKDAAAASAEEALRLAPDAVEPHLAAAATALMRGDRAAGEAAADRALAIDPNSSEALLRKGGVLMARGATREAADAFSRVIERSPGNVAARLRRAEALMQLGDDSAARRDADAALTTMPGSPPALYVRAMLLARAGEWRAADDDLQRLGAQLSSFPDGFFLQAVTKRALNQQAGAEDAARRHAARRPDDPRGAKLVASMEIEAGRFAAAAATLGRFVERPDARPDAELFELLARAQASTGRPREAAEAMARADALAPGNRDTLNRLAAARMAAGNPAGAAEAASKSLEIDPAQPVVRELLATASLMRGDTTRAEAELKRLGDRDRSEAGGVTEGMIQLTRLDLPGARATLTEVLQDYPNSVLARLGLVRVARSEGALEEAERLLGEVLQREPGNTEALSFLSLAAAPGAPRAAEAMAVLEAAQKAAPEEPRLALTLADRMIRAGQAPRAVELLESPALRARGGIGISIARNEALAAAGRWDDAREASRTTLAEDPTSIQARVQFALLTSRAGDARGAEAVLQEGLRATPGDARLQQTLVSMIMRARGIDAALAAADRLAAQPGALPAAATLRGDLFATANRMEDAARAYADAYGRTPSSTLARRRAAVLQSAGKPADAAAALRDWVKQSPNDREALSALAGLDIAAGRLAEAEEGLTRVVEMAPNDATALNNLAWVLDRRGGAGAARARDLAQRAYGLSNDPETADTLGWILVRSGDARTGTALLRQSVAAREAARRPDPSATWRLAYGLRASGQRDEALRVLTPILAGNAAFPERAEAQKLLGDLRAGR
ncbi:MAG TPA: XrtA/PEP-CTERM system TPR-repeat protein PrsT [Roseomonas sp.]|jgi:putative PEP-CTERM system TPR-repeat lipoprotein